MIPTQYDGFPLGDEEKAECKACKQKINIKNNKFTAHNNKDGVYCDGSLKKVK